MIYRYLLPDKNAFYICRPIDGIVPPLSYPNLRLVCHQVFSEINHQILSSIPKTVDVVNLFGSMFVLPPPTNRDHWPNGPPRIKIYSPFPRPRLAPFTDWFHLKIPNTYSELQVLSASLPVPFPHREHCAATIDALLAHLSPHVRCLRIHLEIPDSYLGMYSRDAEDLVHAMEEAQRARILELGHQDSDAHRSLRIEVTWEEPVPRRHVMRYPAWKMFWREKSSRGWFVFKEHVGSGVVRCRAVRNRPSLQIGKVTFA